MNVKDVGILGGGQLAQMLGLAGLPLGIRCHAIDPNPHASATAIAKPYVGALDDAEVLGRLAAAVDVLTFENENVDLDPIRPLAERTAIRPGLRALEVAGDRLHEKRTLGQLGVPTAAFFPVDAPEDLARAAEAVGLPFVLKTRRLGYDGRGQTIVRDLDDPTATWQLLGGLPMIAEALVPFVRECSIIAVRGLDGEMRFYPLVDNLHLHGVLRRSRPLPNAANQARAERYATTLLTSLDYVGVLVLELFEMADGSLLANEIAPRVHNSGHWTIEGAQTCQFEQHLRAVCGLPLGSVELRGASAMVNLLGTVPDVGEVLRCPGARLHLYGKPARPGRKLGHITICAPDEATLDERLVRVRELAGLGPADEPTTRGHRPSEP